MSKKMMWLVPPSDKKTLIDFFGNKPMPWAQSNPMLMMIASWKEIEVPGEKDKNGKDKSKPN